MNRAWRVQNPVRAADAPDASWNRGISSVDTHLKALVGAALSGVSTSRRHGVPIANHGFALTNARQQRRCIG
jgi:hypothetical protein